MPNNNPTPTEAAQAAAEEICLAFIDAEQTDAFEPDEKEVAAIIARHMPAPDAELLAIAQSVLDEAEDGLSRTAWRITAAEQALARHRQP